MAVLVIVHCSDSSWGNAAAITKWHLERGFETIAYHYVILNGRLSPFKMHMEYDGHIETGRPLDDDNDFELDEKGAHAFGYNMAVGLCLIGLSGTFSDSQIRALDFETRKLRKQFGEIIVKQHSDVDPKNKPHCAGLTKLQMNTLNKI
ncbi:MAG: hypothetical protein UR43_C0015G0014 [candidate division TM6 bacterium GW2011_GWF2_33_332]|nr:MAG: hypothetical protein UR43_C0015G0014 [candidate division TM6 bacterium GW2011_GWF2_33_332]